MMNLLPVASEHLMTPFYRRGNREPSLGSQNQQTAQPETEPGILAPSPALRCFPCWQAENTVDTSK